jgi:hypothetical protein
MLTFRPTPEADRKALPGDAGHAISPGRAAEHVVTAQHLYTYFLPLLDRKLYSSFDYTSNADDEWNQLTS